MKFSENISNISAALCAFQSKVTNPRRSSQNPHFRSKYADLDEIITTIRPILEECGLAFVQNPVKDEQGNVGVFTILVHKSGEYMQFDPVVIPLKTPTAHQVGAAMTYARRYSLAAALGIATEEDDDGNSAQPTKEKVTRPTRIDSKPQEVNKHGLAPWEALATEYKKVGRIQQRRFFAQCKQLTDKQQKAIIFYYTGKLSRAEVTEQEYKRINDDIQLCNESDIQMMIYTAVERKKLAASC